MHEVKKFQERSLDRKYTAIFLDGLFFFLKRDKVEKEMHNKYFTIT
jgi:transposase-like protein